ncbi:MAG: hypothetical protein ABW170_11200 [Candidatus Thiodiazotropha sp. L084R]
MLALYPLWRKARRVYSLTSRLPGTNRLGFQPSLALSGCFQLWRSSRQNKWRERARGSNQSGCPGLTGTLNNFCL